MRSEVTAADYQHPTRKRLSRAGYRGWTHELDCDALDLAFTREEEPDVPSYRAVMTRFGPILELVISATAREIGREDYEVRVHIDRELRPGFHVCLACCTVVQRQARETSRQCPDIVRAQGSYIPPECFLCTL